MQPSRHISLWRNLVDNILSNIISRDIIWGNITATISDHPPQSFTSPNTFANPSSNKSNVLGRDWSKLDQEHFIFNYVDIDWSKLLNLNEKNVDLTTNNFLSAMNSLLNKYAPFKKVSKYKVKFRTKPWIYLVYKNQSLLNTKRNSSIKRIHK